MNRNNKIEVAYPFDLFNSFKELSVHTNFPCSALFNDNIIGGLLITCNTDDLEFFNVKKTALPQPDLKFRMINSEQKTFLIEFHLLFDSNKTLRLQLNPIHKSVKLFFNLLIDKKMISFHFYNKQTNLLASSFTTLDEEELEWIIRNNKLINDLDSNVDYLNLSSFMAEKIEYNERLFKFNDSKITEQSFIRLYQKVVKY